MNPLNTQIETIAGELQSSKKYGILHPDTIKNVVDIETQKHKTLKQAAKSARKKLHLILASYLSELNYTSAEEELKIAFSFEDQDKIGETCMKILSKHASTRERIPILAEFYSSIFKITGVPKKLTDLACALNPFSFRWMGLPKDTHYFAFDNNINTILLLKLYFQLEGVKSSVEWRDVLVTPPGLSVDVAFLFKMFHCLEHRQRGAGWEVIEKIPAQWVVVSFPARNLANRKVDIFSNYKEPLFSNLKKNNWEYQRLEFDSEILLLINKK